MIKTNIYDENGELIHGLLWSDDNSAKAFMFDVIMFGDDETDNIYTCVFEDLETTLSGGQYDVFGIYPYEF